MGSLCYKPMLVSGASSVSAVFRTIDSFRGTLVIDESDFRESDEKAEIVKILNNGNARGFPVLRAEQNQRKEFDPRAYTVFGPKLIATRRAFKDQALESRCLTEDMGQGKLRRDIPLNLPPSFEEEALTLRNKLLLFRFQNLGKPRSLAGELPESIEPRLRQIFAPLLSTIEDPDTRREVIALAEDYGRTMVADRGFELEAQVLDVLHELSQGGGALAVKDVSVLFAERYGEEYGGKVTPRWIGSILRKRLNLKPRKYVGSLSSLRRSTRSFGISSRGTDFLGMSGMLGMSRRNQSATLPSFTKLCLFEALPDPRLKDVPNIPNVPFLFYISFSFVPALWRSRDFCCCKPDLIGQVSPSFLRLWFRYC